jgi:hypothetical protein
MTENDPPHASSFYDLRDAMAEQDCPVCRLAAGGADRYMDNLLYESVNDAGLRKQIRRARGFCHTHAWGLVRHGASLGVAIITRDVLQTLVQILDEAHFQPSPLRSLQRALGQGDQATAHVVAQLVPQGVCPVCRQVGEMEGIYLGTLVEHLLGEEGLLPAFEGSDGLCLPHLRRTLIRVHKRPVFDALVGAQQTIWERRVSQLSEVVRKSDYQVEEGLEGEERDAWLRALAALSGAKDGDMAPQVPAL